MTIKFTCSNCATHFSAPDYAAGKGKQCPRCGNALVVPVPVQTQGTQGPALKSHPANKLEAALRVAWIVFLRSFYLLLGTVLCVFGWLTAQDLGRTHASEATIGWCMLGAGVLCLLVGCAKYQKK